MKKFLPLLAASFFLASCQLIPSKSSQGSVSPSSSSPASSEVVAPQEEEVKDDVAQNALLDSTIGMSMLSQNLVPNLSSRVKRAGLLDNFKPNIASIFASQVDNFQFICTLDTASFKTVQSDREEYASLFEALIDLGEENLTMTAQLYYNLTVSPDLSQGLRIDLNGIAAIKEEEWGIPEIPTQGYFISRVVNRQIETSYYLKGALQEDCYAEFSSDFAPLSLEKARDIDLKVVVGGETLFDQSIAIIVPELVSATVYVKVEQEGLGVDVGVSYDEKDAFRIDGKVSYSGLSVTLGADAKVTRDEEGKAKVVEVHFDDDAEDVVYTVNL